MTVAPGPQPLPVNGDASGFAAFVREHSRSLYGTALVLTGDPDAAEELVQDTLVRLYPKWPTVGAADSPLAYVRRALTNSFVSAQRGPRGRVLPMTDPPARAAAPDVADAVANREALVRLLRALPPRQRAALVMRYLYDLPDAEIASALGSRVATVRSLISRGIAAMKAAQSGRKLSAGGWS
jgi:RNA polymerase sigma-70 factor (sigma-E family)